MAKKEAKYENNRQSSIVNRRSSGFSLTEMLIATGIMMIGLVMVATIFPVGVKLTALTTERTIAAVVADEAFAKIQLYGLRDYILWPSSVINAPPYPDPTDTTYETCNDFQYTVNVNGIGPGPDSIWWNADDVNTDEFQYPSTTLPAGQPHNYHWSALCRRVGAKEVQVTVFVTRRIVAASQFRAWDPLAAPPNDAVSDSPWPKPVPVNVDYDSTVPKQLTIVDGPAFNAVDSIYFFDDGYTLIDDLTGKIYRVIEVDPVTGILTLQDDWQWDGYPLAVPPANETRTIWVVPPAAGSSRYPCVGVYQKVIRFDEIQ